MSKTLFDKVWDTHVVRKIEGGPDVLFIDRHLIHEVTSPVAFLGLKSRGIKVLFPERTFATADHNTPTINQHLPVEDPLSANQLKALESNSNEYGISHWGLGHQKNGIVHVVGPEYGITQPGATIVCGDSHTSTHGAFGAIAFGIGTSEVEMVLSTQCIMQPKPKKMRINVNGKLGLGVTPKDVALFIISQLSTSGATGYFVEYAGDVFENMTMEGRMTVCNLSIEMGARGGMIAPDETTIAYVKGREFSPKGEAWDRALAYYKTLKTDPDAVFDKELTFDGASIEPMITYGTNPGMGMGISKDIPDAEHAEGGASTYAKSLGYMGFSEGEAMIGKKIDFVFVGSCTNGRIEDFRAFTSLIKGKHKAEDVTVWLVPGSHIVESQIKEEGLLDILTEAGFTLRQPGCSACLAMNDDKIPAGKYAVSTSNRNFEGRQGPGSRTMLASPLVAAAAAVTGVVTDPRTLMELESVRILEHKTTIKMAYDKFDILTSTAVPLPIENVDTDQLIPARFLKATERVGFGDNLFRDWRYNSDNTPKPDFVLNNPVYTGKILVGGKNFGSGSSREHAAWAVYDYGFRCVVSSFFADIFRNNCLNIGVLPVQVSPAFSEKIFEAVFADPNTALEVNLQEQTITLLATGEKESFEISPYKKHNMLNGFDDIDYLQSIKPEIEEFAAQLPL